MSKALYTLVAAQFLSAFSDNAILFIVVAIALQSGDTPDWYIPALQSVFLIAFVTLAPWVGPWSDRFPKPRVLVAANLVKAAGTLMILSGLEPIAGYTVVGAGAALYSPAKYGILPELVPADRLVRANSGVEGATLAAILTGTLIGAKIADASVTAALSLTSSCYVLSAATSFLLPSMEPRGPRGAQTLQEWGARVGQLVSSTRARLVLTSLSLFWASAATLRIVLVAWAPLVLGLTSAGQIAELTLYLALGIVFGSALVPRFIPIDQVRRTRVPACLLALLFLLLSAVESIWPARCILLGIGIAGGMFVVPLNATMQRIGHASVGSGAAVAIQNLFQNITMLGAVGAYTLAAATGASPVSTILVLGLLILTATLVVSQRLPRP